MMAGLLSVAKAKAVRKIVRTPRGADGLFIQPKELGPGRELVEQHHRQTAAFHGDYADRVCGRPATYDPKGNYRCGDCNMADGNKCLLVSVPKIDREAGSCRGFENKFAGDPEQPLKALSISLAAYGVAEDGQGFGCHRCPYAEKAHAPDSIGRSLYCKVWECRVEPNACCAVNGNPTTELPTDWDKDLDADDAWTEEKD